MVEARPGSTTITARKALKSPASTTAARSSKSQGKSRPKDENSFVRRSSRRVKKEDGDENEDANTAIADHEADQIKEAKNEGGDGEEDEADSPTVNESGNGKARAKAKAKAKANSKAKMTAKMTAKPKAKEEAGSTPASAAGKRGTKRSATSTAEPSTLSPLRRNAKRVKIEDDQEIGLPSPSTSDKEEDAATSPSSLSPPPKSEDEAESPKEEDQEEAEETEYSSDDRESKTKKKSKNKSKSKKSPAKSSARPKAESKISTKSTKSKAEHLQSKKLQTYNEYSSASPFPDFPHPTPGECRRAHKILSALHGARTRPDKVVAQAERAGCGDAPTVLDALVRTILSQNTSDANSTRAKLSMDRTYGGSDQWEAIAAGGQEKLQRTIQSGGLARTKSRVILTILEQTKDRYGTYSLDHLFRKSDGEAMTELIAMKGVGPKTASCVLLFCLGRASFAVDTHVHRITGLLGWRPKSAARDETYSHLDVMIPDEEKYGLHILFVTHGKECDECKAGGKNVGKCELRKAFQKGSFKEEEEEGEKKEDVKTESGDDEKEEEEEEEEEED